MSCTCAALPTNVFFLYGDVFAFLFFGEHKKSILLSFSECLLRCFLSTTASPVHASGKPTKCSFFFFCFDSTSQ